MPFVKVPGLKVQFCIWETRRKDYAIYFEGFKKGRNYEWEEPYFGFKYDMQEETHPVVNVNWWSSRLFCVWLTKKEQDAGKLKPGQRYRLPTDAEWSVAVGLWKETGDSPSTEKTRGIVGSYPWGNEWPPPKGAGNYAKDLKVDSFEYTSPVGRFAANAHGLHDMGGNVAEWCEDGVGAWPSSRFFRDSGPKKYSYRVARGSHHALRVGVVQNFDDHGRNSISETSSFRNHHHPDTRDGFIGFRCVLADE